MMDLYILKNRVVVPASMREWSEFFHSQDRKVEVDQFGDVTVSTVFLGINHRFSGAGPPLVFETMVFGGALNDLQERCATWEEAEAIHERVCREVRALQ